MDESGTGRVRTVIPGWSLWQWICLILASSGAVGFLSVVLAAVVVITRTWVTNPLVSGILIAAGIAIVCIILGNVMGSVRRDQEFAAGYTTSRGGYLQYDQVDESTGLVVRDAGDPALTRAQYRAKIDAFRATQTQRK